MSEIPYSFSAFPLTMLSSSIILQISRLTYTYLYLNWSRRVVTVIL